MGTLEAQMTVEIVTFLEDRLETSLPSFSPSSDSPNR